MQNNARTYNENNTVLHANEHNNHHETHVLNRKTKSSKVHIY